MHLWCPIGGMGQTAELAWDSHALGNVLEDTIEDTERARAMRAQAQRARRRRIASCESIAELVY